ncbi:MAG: hypothetical protein VXY77_02855 [Pseudomonadota bacterium]|nr:hypothetical protein [Pseudomonadota bacterium]
MNQSKTILWEYILNVFALLCANLIPALFVLLEVVLAQNIGKGLLSKSLLTLSYPITTLGVSIGTVVSRSLAIRISQFKQPHQVARALSEAYIWVFRCVIFMVGVLFLLSQYYIWIYMPRIPFFQDDLPLATGVMVLVVITAALRGIATIGFWSFITLGLRKKGVILFGLGICVGLLWWRMMLDITSSHEGSQIVILFTGPLIAIAVTCVSQFYYLSQYVKFNFTPCQSKNQFIKETLQFVMPGLASASELLYMPGLWYCLEVLTLNVNQSVYPLLALFQRVESLAIVCINPTSVGGLTIMAKYIHDRQQSKLKESLFYITTAYATAVFVVSGTLILIKSEVSFYFLNSFSIDLLQVFSLLWLYKISTINQCTLFTALNQLSASFGEGYKPWFYVLVRTLLFGVGVSLIAWTENWEISIIWLTLIITQWLVLLIYWLDTRQVFRHFMVTEKSIVN